MKTNITIKRVLSTVFFLFVISVAFGQPPEKQKLREEEKPWNWGREKQEMPSEMLRQFKGSSPPPQSIPIDGGLGFLLLAGVLYGVMFLRTLEYQEEKKSYKKVRNKSEVERRKAKTKLLLVKKPYAGILKRTYIYIVSAMGFGVALVAFDQMVISVYWPDLIINADLVATGLFLLFAGVELFFTNREQRRNKFAESEAAKEVKLVIRQKGTSYLPQKKTASS